MGGTFTPRGWVTCSANKTPQRVAALHRPTCHQRRKTFVPPWTQLSSPMRLTSWGAAWRLQLAGSWKLAPDEQLSARAGVSCRTGRIITACALETRIALDSGEARRGARAESSSKHGNQPRKSLNALHTCQVEGIVSWNHTFVATWRVTCVKDQRAGGKTWILQEVEPQNWK